MRAGAREVAALLLLEQAAKASATASTRTGRMIDSSVTVTRIPAFSGCAKTAQQGMYLISR